MPPGTEGWLWSFQCAHQQSNWQQFNSWWSYLWVWMGYVRFMSRLVRLIALHPLNSIIKYCILSNSVITPDTPSGPAMFLACAGYPNILLRWWPSFLVGSFLAEQLKSLQSHWRSIKTAEDSSKETTTIIGKSEKNQSENNLLEDICVWDYNYTRNLRFCC